MFPFLWGITSCAVTMWETRRTVHLDIQIVQNEAFLDEGKLNKCAYFESKVPF